MNVIDELNGYKNKLESFKQVADEVKTKRIRNEAKLETLKSSQDSIVADIKKLGYEPDELGKVIKDKLALLKTLSDKLDAAMPNENGVVDPEAIKALTEKKTEKDNVKILLKGKEVATTTSVGEESLRHVPTTPTNTLDDIEF